MKHSRKIVGLIALLALTGSAVAGSWAINFSKLVQATFPSGAPAVFTNQSAVTIYLVGAYMSTTQNSGSIAAPTNRWVEIAVGAYGTNRVFATNLTDGATYVEFPTTFPVTNGGTWSVWMFNGGSNDHVDVAVGNSRLGY